MYIADGTKNDIADYQACVIHNRSRVDYQKQRIRNYVNVEAYLEIEDIDVCPVESPATIKYQINSIKNTFSEKDKRSLWYEGTTLRPDNRQFLHRD